MAVKVNCDGLLVPGLGIIRRTSCLICVRISDVFCIIMQEHTLTCLPNVSFLLVGFFCEKAGFGASEKNQAGKKKNMVMRCHGLKSNH